MKVNWKDVFIRAGKTFLQAAGSYLVATLVGVNFFTAGQEENFWIGLFVSTGAAGISAAWNIIVGALKPEEPAE